MRAAAAAIVAIALACAAPVPAAAEPVPLTGGPLEVQLWPGGTPGYTLIFVTGTLPEDVALPALVQLPVPPGAEVVWVGELLGGPVELDPAREYRIAEGTGAGTLEFVAEDSRVVQLEAVGPALTVRDGLIGSDVTWIQSTHPAEVVFSVRIPAASDSVRIAPVPPSPPLINEAGERLYTLPSVALAEGATHEVSFAYGPGGAASDVDARSNLIAWLLAALALALFALMAVYVRDKRRAHSAE